MGNHANDFRELSDESDEAGVCCEGLSWPCPENNGSGTSAVKSVKSVNNVVDEVSEARRLDSGPSGVVNGCKSSSGPGGAGNDRASPSTLGRSGEGLRDSLSSGTSRVRTTSSDLSDRSDGSSSVPCGDTIDLI
jgi:hypothetical protein